MDRTFDIVMVCMMMIPVGVLLWIMFQELVPYLPLTPGSRKRFARKYEAVRKHLDENLLFVERLAEMPVAPPQHEWRTRGAANKCIRELVAKAQDKYTRLLTRAQVKEENKASTARGVATSCMLTPDIGYLRITTFTSANCAREAQAALEAIKGARAFVLDLQFNRGGLLDEAFKVYSLLVQSGLFTTLKGREDGKDYETVLELTQSELKWSGSKTKTAPRLTCLIGDMPLVVLINGTSASASELLSGALKSRPNTVLMGAKSFGKGIGQTTGNHGAKDWRLKVTSFYFYLPDGECVNGKGVVPDIEVAYCKCCNMRREAAKKYLTAKLGEATAAPLAASDE